MRRPLRILHLLAPAEVGGLETVVATLAAGQAQRVTSVMVATVLEQPHQNDAPRAVLEDKAVEIHPLFIRGRRYLSERRAVEKLLHNWRPHVLHTHGYRPDVVDAPVARRRGVPTVTTVHGFTGNDLKNRFLEWIQRRALRGFDAVVVVSTQLGDELGQVGVPRERIHVVQNAWAPPSAFLSREEARARLGMAGDEPVVGWVGRFTPEKAPDLMVKAFSLVGAPGTSLAMIGDGWMRDELQRLATHLGVSHRIRWLGTVPEAFRFFRAFDVLVLTSQTEGTPMVLLEAMAAGVPIVSRAVGGVPELLSNQEAILIRTGVAEKVARAIQSVFSAPKEAHARVDRARLRFQRDFSVEPWVERYLQIYDALQK